MADLWDDIKAKFQSLAGGWAAYSALGSFVLYVFGYLAVRFHLTTLGIGTDLAVLDERYLFTGARFLVYMLSLVPSLLIIVIILSIPGSLIFLIVRRIGKAFHKEPNEDESAKQTKWQSIRTFLTGPRAVALLAIVISVVTIQKVMRECFYFTNLLLARSLPATTLNLHRLLFDGYDGWQSVYFTGLVAATALTGALLYYAVTRAGTNPAPNKLLVFLVGLLFAVQFLLLPVNYGVFILEKEIPKVTDLGDQNPLKPGEEAWLVWEGSQGMTYLVATNGLQQGQRRLVTLPKKDLKKLEIVQYDGVISLIFNH